MLGLAFLHVPACHDEVRSLNPTSVVVILRTGTHFWVPCRQAFSFALPTMLQVVAPDVPSLQEAQPPPPPDLLAEKKAGCKTCSQKYPEEASRNLPARKWVPKAESGLQLPAKARAGCHRDGNSPL